MLEVNLFFEVIDLLYLCYKHATLYDFLRGYDVLVVLL